MSDGDVPLVRKYRPQSLDDVQGNNSDIATLKAWVREFDEGDSAHLLHGPPGVGKSSTVEALAREFDLPLTEINASDARRSDEIQSFVAEAESKPFTGGHKMILLDEVDSMSGNTNLQPLYDTLDNPSNPIVLVCNDKYEVPNGILDRVDVHKFSLGVRSRKAKLKEIVQSESLDFGASTISMLAQRENLRDAIQDLQTLAKQEEGVTGDDGRTYDESIFEEIDRIIKGKPASLSETPDTGLLWVDKNIRGRYRLVEAAAAWDALSRADMANDRVWQGSGDPDYRWWKYSSTLIEQVPYLRLSNAYDGYIDKGSPDYYGYDSIPSNVEDAYEKMKSGPSDSFEFAGSLVDFRRRVVPLLKNLSSTERCELALEYGLSGSELEVLDLTQSEFDDWREGDQSEDEADDSHEESTFMDW